MRSGLMSIVRIAAFCIALASAHRFGDDGFEMIQTSVFHAVGPEVKVQEGVGQYTPAPDGPDGDSLSVMLLNTYFIEVSLVGGWMFPTPNLDHRATATADWFNTLTREETPDVLVLNEIFGPTAERFMKLICSDNWGMFLGRSLIRKTTTCRASSNFAMATPVNGAQFFHFELTPPGGVVILVKKGLAISSYETVNFAKQSFPDAKRGFTAVKLEKQGKAYTVIGTHLTCCVGAEIKRAAQLAQIRGYIDKSSRDGDRVLFVGDFNLYQFPMDPSATDTSGKPVDLDSWVDEVPRAKALLGSDGSSVISGDLDMDGFWLQLDRAVKYSWDNVTNHQVNHLKSSRVEYGQRYDWIFAPGAGDRLASPTGLKFQYVPVKSPSCFESELAAGLGGDDLSDHYGVFAQACYKPGGCPPVVPVSGHTGALGRLPGTSPDCPPVVTGGPPTIPKSPIAKLAYHIGITLGLKPKPSTYN